MDQATSDILEKAFKNEIDANDSLTRELSLSRQRTRYLHNIQGQP